MSREHLSDSIFDKNSIDKESRLRDKALSQDGDYGITHSSIIWNVSLYARIRCNSRCLDVIEGGKA